MDFLTISELFLMLCLVIYMFATLRIAARKTTGSALAGVAGFTIALAVVLTMVTSLTGVTFCRDIAFALIVLSPVGTIAAATVLGGGEI
jgi:energy-converting hydrogenase B subunit B